MKQKRKVKRTNLNTALVTMNCATFNYRFRNDVHKVEDFFESLVPEMNLPQYRRWFRMNPNTFEDLVLYLIDDDHIHFNGRRPIEFRKRLAMTCTFLGTSLPSFHLAQIYGISEEAFLRQTTNMMNYLIINIKDIITFPRKEDFAAVAAQFDLQGRCAYMSGQYYKFRNQYVFAYHIDNNSHETFLYVRWFPNVIGALDSCHLRIELHGLHRLTYVNYKKFPSINLMAIALADLRFSAVYAGFPGVSIISIILTI